MVITISQYLHGCYDFLCMDSKMEQYPYYSFKKYKAINSGLMHEYTWLSKKLLCINKSVCIRHKRKTWIMKLYSAICEAALKNYS